MGCTFAAVVVVMVYWAGPPDPQPNVTMAGTTRQRTKNARIRIALTGSPRGEHQQASSEEDRLFLSASACVRSFARRGRAAESVGGRGRGVARAGPLQLG